MDWIFQAVPKRYDLRERLEVGNEEVWLVTRYREEMRRGDRVFFWLGGPPEIRGIYGEGEIVEDRAEYYPDWGWGIRIKYIKKFEPHIGVDEIVNLPEMKQHHIIRMPSGTNFRLSKGQSSKIESLASGRSL